MIDRQTSPERATTPHERATEAALTGAERASKGFRLASPWGVLAFAAVLAATDPRPCSSYAWWMQVSIVVAAVLAPASHTLAAGVATTLAYLAIFAIPLRLHTAAPVEHDFDAYLVMTVAITLGAWTLKRRLERSNRLGAIAQQDADATTIRLDALRARTLMIADELDHALWIAEPERGVIFVNRGFERLWGRPGHILRQDPSAWRAAVNLDDREILSTLGDTERAYRISTPAGEERWVAHVLHKVEGAREVHIVRDITTLRREAAYRSRYAELLIKLQEDERSQVAQALKERLGQSLAAILVGMRQLEGSAPSSPAAAQIRWMRQSLREAVDELGRIAGDLHPSFLEELGLAAALQRLADQAKSKWNLQVRVCVGDIGATSWPEGLRMAVYRITEEAVRNVGRHADATHIDIDLGRRDHQLTLSIEDDGRGFTPEAVMHSGAGMLEMQQRANLLGGSFRIESAPGSGSTVMVQLPLPPAAQDG